MGPDLRTQYPMTAKFHLIYFYKQPLLADGIYVVPKPSFKCNTGKCSKAVKKMRKRFESNRL
jgi:hypothetical protein